MPYEFRFFSIRVKLGKPVPKEAIIKRRAHALTILSVAWIGLSAAAAVAYKIGNEDSLPEWIKFAWVVWNIHIGLALATIVVWIFERPSYTKFVTESPDDDSDEPESNDSLSK